MAIQSIDEWLANQGGPSGASKQLSTNPLDTGAGKRPYMDIDKWLASNDKEPQISQETLAATSKAPSGEPSGEPKGTAGKEASVAPSASIMAAGDAIESLVPDVQRKQEIAQQARETLASQGVNLSPYVTGGYPTQEMGAAAARPDYAETTKEGQEAAQQFIKEEALPVVGATVGALLAPVSGGSSILLSSALVAGSAGLGGFTGELIEQTGQYTGVLDPRKSQEAPKDGWDILERAAWRGGEEAAWSLVPDLFVKGATQGLRKLLTHSAKPAVTVAGETVDMGRQSMVNIMKDYAEKHGVDQEKILLTSDVVESGLFNAAENIASNSYITGKVGKVRAVQEEALKEEIVGVVEGYTTPALNYLKNTDDTAIANFVGSNMDSMNDFGVAGLVNVGFKKAQDAQKAVARSIYKSVGELMEATKMQTVYKEVELPILGPDGRPLTTMQTVTEETPAFPVSLRGVRELAEERMDILARTGDRLDSNTASFLNMPMSTDYSAAAERLVDMKADSRSLARSTAEGSAKQKMLLDQAIAKLEASMDDAMNQATASGITGPDGVPIAELKAQADAIWKEQVEDFQNSYVMNIIKKTHPKNGAPEKLGQLFIQNETAAKNIMKVLDDAKGNLKGAELEQVIQAENAIKGSIVEQVFMPFDSTSGKYIAPDVTALTTKEEPLRRIFGDEGYDELRKLGAAIERQSGGATSNYLGFAQRARESGMIMTTMKGMARADFGPLIRDGGATVLFALGAGKVLTSPKMLRQVNMILDPKVDPAIKTNIAQWLVHRTYEYQQAVEASMTPDERERAEAKLEDSKEASMMRKGM
ncbi:hypothetical protein CHOED_017 [Vibrio phage CHOED]|uniref:hypothetical protein n=1 Tax=Vibrio phage CHOED TaxID=1458716 RepID=UPI00042E1F3C|nr:hypothetical protein CHOED_017 [Vibrio phage CHOED]AHK11877.1 hypothetical protein CHOED_017 [Vibrio phage CHOED]